MWNFSQSTRQHQYQPITMATTNHQYMIEFAGGTIPHQQLMIGNDDISTFLPLGQSAWPAFFQSSAGAQIYGATFIPSLYQQLLAFQQAKLQEQYYMMIMNATMLQQLCMSFHLLTNSALLHQLIFTNAATMYAYHQSYLHQQVQQQPIITNSAQVQLLVQKMLANNNGVGGGRGLSPSILTLQQQLQHVQAAESRPPRPSRPTPCEQYSSRRTRLGPYVIRRRQTAISDDD